MGLFWKPGLAVLWVVLWLCQAAAMEEGQHASALTPSTNALRDEFLRGIGSNDVLRVKALLKADPKLANATNELYEPVLVQAARQGGLELVKALLDAGAAVDAAGWREETALYQAFEPVLGYRTVSRVPPAPEGERESRLSLIQLLLERGASIFRPSRYGQTVISRAGREGDGELVDFLLVHQRPDARDSEGNSVVHRAALWGRTNVLKALVEGKVSLEATNGAGLTPLQAVARLPRAQEDSPFTHGWVRSGRWSAPSVDAGGPALRQTTAQFLVELGATRDLFSAIALSWTNVVRELITRRPELARVQNGAGQTPLHWAAEYGELELARTLLAAGAPLEVVDRQRQRPLDVAAARGQTEVARLLVKAGATAARAGGSKTPLHWAAEQGNLALLDLFLQAGGDPNAEDDHRQAPVDAAARANQAGALKWLLAHDARLKTGGTNTTIPLHWAVANANTNLMTLLLQLGSDINARTEEGKSPLHIAHEKDSFDLLEFLLAQGANIKARDTNGNTVLHLRAAAATDRFALPPGELRQLLDKALADPAVKKRVPQMLLPKRPTRSMMEFLLHHGAQVNATNAAGETPLHRVAARPFDGTNAVAEARGWIQPLVRGHAKVNAQDSKGRTPLHLAVQGKNGPVVEALVTAGAKGQMVDNVGANPLHLFSGVFEDTDTNAPAVLELLLKAGANINARDKTGATPLHVALTTRNSSDDFNRRAGLVALLVNHKADVNARDQERRTPLLLASTAPVYCQLLIVIKWVLPGDSEATEIGFDGYNSPVPEPVPAVLLTNGAAVNVADRDGNTPLHFAAKNVRIDFAKMLLAHGAARKVRNKAGKTPLDLAYEEHGGFQIIPVLQTPKVEGEIAVAALHGDLATVRAFLEDDPYNVDRPWFFSSTALQWASSLGNLAMVELLLKYGAAVDPPKRVRDERARTVEMNACMNSFPAESNRLWVAQMNGQMPAGAQATNDSGSVQAEFPESKRRYLRLTPLQLALAGGHTNVAAVLVKHGAKVDLASAASLGRLDLLQAAIGADRQRVHESSYRASWFYAFSEARITWNAAVGEQTGTLLHFAVRGDQPKVVEYLLAAGADPALADDEGRTPYQLALEEGYTALADLLRQHGVDKPKPRVKTY